MFNKLEAQLLAKAKKDPQNLKSKSKDRKN